MASTRRLAAILAADVAGYSRLMGADEEGTHERLRAHRRELIEPKISEHSGRVVKTTGDGMLVEFPSVVDAVRCAAEWQRAMIDREAGMPEDRRIRFRVGINLGDVIVEDEDIFGDGVNVAARLEALAEPGGICISRTVRDQIRDKLAYAFEDLGEQSVKNIARPVRVYALRLEAVADLPAPSVAFIPSVSQPAVAPRLSIVVLPFANLSNDPEQQYFADGITEDLTTDLSRIPDMLVISRNTAFTFKDKRVDTKQIGRELCVRYILEGSVRRSGNQVRVNSQLIDAETDAHLWAERFDGDMGDLFALQNDLTGRIANTLNLELISTEAARLTPGSDALDYILRARAERLKPVSRDVFAEAISLLEHALALDPQSVEAQSLLASWLMARVNDNMTDSAAADIERAKGLSERALAASPRSPLAHFAKGQVLRAQRRFEEAIPEYETAAALNPNWVNALHALSQCKLYAGSIEETIPLMEQAVRLSPRDPQLGIFYGEIGRVHLLQSRTGEAITWYEKARNHTPAQSVIRSWLASAYALNGEPDRAAAELAEARRLSGDDRFSSLARLRAVGYLGVPKIRALFEATYFVGLRKAGMPEKRPPHANSKTGRAAMRCVHSRGGHNGRTRCQRVLTCRPFAPAKFPHRAANVLSTALVASLIAIGSTPAAAATCASLTSLALPDTKITAAQPIPAATDTAPYTAPDGEVFTNLPAFCRVAATLMPTSDSNIKVEVWMRYSGWNGRYLGTGNGGIGGVISYSSLAPALQFGDAVANTDMGTSPAATDPLGGRVLIGHPEKQIDYATRSTHLMTVFAKQIIAAFYGEPANHSYFYGCSTGGGQAIHEALQFPGDYDGIGAGAPEINRTHSATSEIWDYGSFNRSPVNITTAEVSAINAAIVKQCVGKDGGLSSDNFLTDPRDCHWDPAVLQCAGSAADAPTCLIAAQVAAMRKFYQGPINPRTGQRIYAGRLPGSEINPYGPIIIEAEPLPNTNSPYWAFGANFDWQTFDFDRDMDALDEALAATLNANTADLAEFKSHGGKLVLWQGFADPRVPTLNLVAYYERLIASQTPGDGDGKGERKEGLRRTQEFARLFLAPGVAHCGGGAGADTFDPVIPVEQWVETGVAPDQIVASKVVNGAATFTRPLCPYPALPRYSGVGDTTKASSFACVADGDQDDNQPPVPKYLNDGDNYPIVPIDDRGHDHGHDHDNR